MRQLFLPFLLWAPLSAAALSYPAGVVVDVTQSPYDADPSGVVDATAAIQSALDDHDGAITERTILYFPEGTYRITDTLRLDTHSEPGGGSGRGIILQGAGEGLTTLQLDSGADGFGDPANPQAVVDFNEANDLGGAWQFVAFQTHIKDLTLDVGSGNPGAIGIDFCANNCGGIRNVTVRSPDPEGAGRYGILLSSIPGPQFLKNLRVEGFDWAITTSMDPHYHTVIEDLELVGSREGGILNKRTSLTVHRMTGVALEGPALRNDHADAFTVLVDADLDGTGEEPFAVDNSGFLFLRDIRSTDYEAVLRDVSAGTLAQENVSEWLSHAGQTLFPEEGKGSLRLPVKDAPEPAMEPVEEWVSALQFGGNVEPGDFNNDAHRVQQAIDSMGPGGENEGRHTLYLPPGLYLFDHEVVITPHVHRIVGCYARIKPRHAAIESDPVWRIAAGRSEAILMEQLFSEPGGGLRKTPFILDETEQAVVLRDLLVLAGQAYEGEGSGEVFLENVSGTSSRYWSGLPQPLPEAVPQFAFGSQSVWARQLNTEQKDLKVRNEGGQLWILGIKNEEDGTLIETTHGGRTELLGGTLMPLDVEDTASPAFVIEEASASFVTAGHVGWARDVHPILVRETRNGETRTLATADAPLKRGYTNEAGDAPAVLTLYRGSVLTGAEHWRMNFFGQPGNSGNAEDAADPDADGRSNLHERAFATDPLRPDAGDAPRMVQWMEGAEAYVGLEVTAPAGGTLSPESGYSYGPLNVRLQQSANPVSGWSDAASGPLRVDRLGDDGRGRHHVRLGLPFATPLFLRFFIEE